MTVAPGTSEFYTTLAVCIRHHDADALHSLVDENSELINNLSRQRSQQSRLFALLSPEDLEWFRLQLGGEKERITDIKVDCIELVSLSYLAKIIQVNYFDLRRFLLTSKYKLFYLMRRDRIIAEAVYPQDVLSICLDLVIFLSREKLAKIKPAPV